MDGVHFTEPRNSIPLEKRIEAIKKEIRNKYSDGGRWLIVTDTVSNTSFYGYTLDIAKKIGVSPEDVRKAVNKGILLKGKYFIDEDF